MKKIKPHWKAILIIATTLCSWILFPFFVYGEKNISNIVPLVILVIQIAVIISYKKRILLLLTLLNPVIFLALTYTINPAINYINGTPTIIECCYYRPSVPSFDLNKSVHIEYFDDDCDWGGLYYYTLEINNAITDRLITLFGNPIKHNNDQGNKEIKSIPMPDSLGIK